MNELEYKIERGIPIPQPRHGHGEVATTVRRMKIGDSVLISRGSLASWVTVGRREGIKFCSRQLSPGSSDIRVWRVK